MTSFYTRVCTLYTGRIAAFFFVYVHALCLLARTQARAPRRAKQLHPPLLPHAQLFRNTFPREKREHERRVDVVEDKHLHGGLVRSEGEELDSLKDFEVGEWRRRRGIWMSQGPQDARRRKGGLTDSFDEPDGVIDAAV